MFEDAIYGIGKITRKNQSENQTKWEDVRLRS